MKALIKFLKTLFIKLPQEILVALLQLLWMLLLILLLILIKVWECLLRWLKNPKFFQEEKEEKKCAQLPESLMRRPDPCLYSQRLLMAQGLPVTWNNPDIWVARADNPGNIEPDSYHLVENQQYIVTVRVHNASTDLALGVRVRLVYRPWSFNSPDLVPVETDSGGTEVVRFVNVAPMGSSTVQFNWLTPKNDPGAAVKHYCLMAGLFHPLDTNTANNVGQENTNVYSANPGHVSPGELVQVEVPVFNTTERVKAYRFNAWLYDINEQDKVELQLKTTLGHARRPFSQRLATIMPTLHPSRKGLNRIENGRGYRSRFSWQSKNSIVGVKTKYVGFDAFKKAIGSRDYSIPPGMIITANGRSIQDLQPVQPGTSEVIQFTIKVPDDAVAGTTLPLTLTAQTAEGGLAGGVTLLLTVK